MTNCNNCGKRTCRLIHAEVNNDGDLYLREHLPKDLRGNNLTRCKMFQKLTPVKIPMRFILSDQSLINTHIAVWRADTKRALASRK